MTTTKKILATTAAIAFAATLSSCEMKKWEEKNEVETAEIKTEVPAQKVEEPIVREEPTQIEPIADQANAPQETAGENIPNPDATENPKMAEFQKMQEKMWKLYNDFAQNNEEVKKIQDEINAIFTSWKQPTEEDMKRVQELDQKMQSLFTPEMKELDAQIRKMADEIFWNPWNQQQAEAPAEPAQPVEPTAETWWDQPMIELK